MRHYRWIILGLLFYASVINYIDRQSLSILARTIQNELGIDNVGYANVVQAFMLAYMLSFLVAGWVTDRLGVRASMTLFIGWWSIANLLTGFVGSLRGLAATRFLLGAGESGLYVVAPKVVSQLFPASQRGLAVGIYSAGATIGATIAPPLIAWLALNYGWRSAFIAGGALGLVWIIPWLLLYRVRTSEEPAAPAPPLTVSRTESPAPANPGSPTVLDYQPRLPDHDGWRWWHAFLSKPVLLLLTVRAITDPVWQFILFWFPKYMTDVRHLSLDEIGYVGWIPYLAADIGGVLGGYASGLLVHRGLRPADARKWAMLVCATAIPICAILIPLTSARSVVVVLLALIAFFEFTWIVTTGALSIDVLPPKRLGQMMGIIAAGSGLGGIVSAWVVGRLVTSYSYTPVFVLMACLHPVAMVLVWWVAKLDRKAAAAAGPPAVPDPLPVATRATRPG